MRHFIITILLLFFCFFSTGVSTFISTVVEGQAVLHELKIDTDSCKDDVDRFLKEYMERISAASEEFKNRDLHYLMETFPEGYAAVVANVTDDKIIWTFPEVDHYIGNVLPIGVSYGHTSPHRDFKYVSISVKDGKYINGQCVSVTMIQSFVNDTYFSRNQLIVLDSKNQILAAPTQLIKHFGDSLSVDYIRIPASRVQSLPVNSFAFMAEEGSVYLVYSVFSDYGWRIVGLTNLTHLGLTYSRMWMVNTFIVFIFSLLVWFICIKFDVLPIAKARGNINTRKY